MKEFPEVKKLFGIDKSLKFKTVLLVIAQLSIPILIKDFHWAIQLLTLLIVGATISHALFLAIHEITHDLAFKKRTPNNWLAIFANLPIIFPYAMAFRIYHQEHHWHQGKDGVDMDIPAEQEALIFRGYFGKLIWLVNQILFYALRPVILSPKKPTNWIIINAVVQIAFVIGYFLLFGWFPLLFLLLGIVISGGLHPIAGHFISEHYVVKEGQETYSYYGIYNKLTFNVGYHNEHHDFPNIPGSRLPKLKKIAASHYDHLYAHKSWSKLLFRFVLDQNMTLFNRFKRTV